jgi:hypothetical protein
VDLFGNATTAFGPAEVADVLAAAGSDPARVVVDVGGAVLPLVNTYAEVASGEPCALVGSGGRLEVAVNQGRAADRLGLSRGARVRVRVLPEPPGPGEA